MNQVTSEKIKLLYIASTGRAGSTVLEMLLNAQPSMWTLGEFHILPWEILTNRKPCGCGIQVEECPFWGPIIRQKRSIILNGTIKRFRRAHNVDRSVRLRELPFLMGRKASFTQRRSEDIQRYAADNDDILRSVLSASHQMRSPQVRWLVDSSKSPYRLMWLAASQQFELRTIHLTKDPRAFAYSMSKTNRGLRQVYSTVRSSLRWQVQNRQFNAVIRNYMLPEHSIHLKYEELASEPEGVMKQICDWLDIPFEPGATARFRDGNHGIAGNPSRAESKPIRLDDKWRRELPATLAKVSLAINSQLARAYGHTP